MLPLGDLWAGECHVEPGQPSHAVESGLRTLCNLGYARGACSRFPAGEELPDAVRFTIAGDRDSRLRLYYVIERNHHPFAHGPLEYSRDLDSFVPPPEDGILRCQAKAYVKSYLRRKSEAAAR